MSWLLTALSAWQHSHPFISSHLGHLPIFLPFQILLTQNETNTNRSLLSLAPEKQIPSARYALLIPPKIGLGFYLSIISL